MAEYIEVVIGNLKKRSGDRPVPFSGEEFSRLVQQISKDGATGTWIDAKGLQKVTGVEPAFIEANYGVTFDVVRAESGQVKLLFPLENFSFEYGGIPHLLGTIAGDILGYPNIGTATVQDLRLPHSVLAQYGGPQCGIEGVRRVTEVERRPLIAFTVKPRLGLGPREYAQWCVEAAAGGADIVEDDERLVSPQYCPIERRLEAVLRAFEKNRIKKTTYSVNITGNSSKIVPVADKLLRMGARMFKLDVLPAGFSALQALSQYLQGKNVPITVYPGMGFLYGAISRSVLLRLTRLCGGDVVYAGTPSLGGELGRHDVNSGELNVSVQKTKNAWQVLKRELHKQQPSMPTVSTNIHAGNIGLMYHIATTEGFDGPIDFAYFIGGGISFHADGPREGAAMCRKALDLAMAGKFRAEDFPAKYRRVFEQNLLSYFSVEEYRNLKSQI